MINDPIAKAKDYAQKKYVAKNRELQRRLTEQITEIEARHRSDPVGDSSLKRRDLGKAHYEVQEALVKARVDALLEGFRLYGVEITVDLSEFIIREAEKLNDQYLASATHDANTSANQGPGARPVLWPLRVPMESFHCQIEEQRLKSSLVAQDVRVAMPERKGTIFISCGQFSPAEKALGIEVAKLVEELTPYEPYFAENQASLDGFTHNILGNLNRALGLIAIMHPRGKVSVSKRRRETRASVWIEQEIAIAAFRAQVLKRQLPIALYIHADVCREGMREQLLLNPVLRFRDDSEIIESLREYLPTWQLGGIAVEEFPQQATNPADERRWQAVKKEIDGLPDYNREGLRLLLDFPSLTDYTALQKLGQIARQHSLASILPGLQNVTGIVRIVPNQPATKSPEYELQFEITPELKPYLERYFRSISS